MSTVLPFTRFAKGLQEYKPKVEAQVTLEANRLNKTYDAFVKALAPSKPNATSKQLAEAFSKKYQVNVPTDETFKDCVITYTHVFRKMFPALNLESQKYSYQLSKEKINPFQVQWELIGAFIAKPLKSLDAILCDILSKNPTFDDQHLEIKALVDAGATLTTKVGQASLICDDPEIFECINAFGYKPTENDLIFLFKIKKFEKKAAKTKVLVELGVKVHADIAPLTYEDLKSFELLLCYGYKPTQKDLIQIFTLHGTEKSLPFLEQFKLAGNAFSNEECIFMLSGHFSKHGYVDESSLKLLNRLITAISPYSELHSNLLQKMFPYLRSFLAFGYKPTLQDLQAAAEVGEQEIVKRIVETKVTSLSDDELICVLSAGLDVNYLSKIVRKNTITQTVFRAAIDQGKISLPLILKDMHNYSNPARYRASGNYELSPEDLVYAAEKNVCALTFDLLVHCWSYVPPKSLFEAVLKSPQIESYMKVLINADFSVSTNHFRNACEMKYPYKILSILLNFGRVRYSHDERIEYYTGNIVSYPVFEAENAGYIPSKDDLEFAEKQGYEKEVLELIESKINRHTYSVYTNRYGQMTRSIVKKLQ